MTAVLAGLGLALAPALAQDPLAPRTSAADALVSPLAAVTIGTTDLAAVERFYGQAMGMRCERFTLTGAPARAFRRTLTMVSNGTAGNRVDATTCRRGDPRVAQVRAVLLPANAPIARPDMDSRIVGPLSMGFPSASNTALDKRVTGLNFGSTAGLTTMTLPRGDGTTYQVGEVHYRAPENVYVLGIDRGTMPSVGPIETAIGVGGPAYSGMMIGDAGAAAKLFGDVLGMEMRRKVELTSSGPEGGLGLPAKTRFDFQQWYAPGATSGYVILMKLLDNERAAVAPPGLKSRGIGMWTFTTTKFDTLVERATRAGMRVTATPSPWPEDGGRRSMMLTTSDGFPVQIVEAARAEAAPAAMAPASLDPIRCDNKPVIMLVSGLLKDRDRLMAYAQAIRESGLYDRLGGYYMNSPRKVATFEGAEPENASTLMVRFPCLAHARAFWYSSKYQRDIVPLRQNPSAGDFTVTVYPEIALPAYMAGRVQPGGYSWQPGYDVAGSVEQVPGAAK